jgi:hypothetical protein
VKLRITPFYRKSGPYLNNVYIAMRPAMVRIDRELIEVAPKRAGDSSHGPTDNERISERPLGSKRPKKGPAVRIPFAPATRQCEPSVRCSLLE